MNSQLLERLKEITEEERAILDGNSAVRKELYASGEDFVVDSGKMLKKGKLIDIRPHTRFVHFPKHRHNYIEMIYVCSGETTHIINQNARIVLKEGDLLLLNQHVTQEILPAGAGDIAINFIVLPEFFDRAFMMLEEDNILRDFFVASLRRNDEEARYLYFETSGILPVQNLIENMIWSILNKQNYKQSVNQTTMGLLFMCLLNCTENLHYNDSNQYERNLVADILRYIEESYRTARLDEYAAKIEKPAYYLSKLLKKHTGYSFKDALKQKRLNQTAYLLRNTRLSTEAIMTAVGYENNSYFHRIFKERYGCTPKEFRETL